MSENKKDQVMKKVKIIFYNIDVVYSFISCSFPFLME